MRSLLTILLLGLVLIGCTEAQIARAEAAAATARQSVERAEAMLSDAQQALTIAQAVVAATGNADAKAAIEKAKATVDALQEGLPVAIAAAEAAEKAAADAKRGARWWEIGLGVVTTLIGAAVPILRARSATSTMTKVAEAAITVADQLKPLAEAKDAKAAKAILDEARTSQADAGIRSIVQGIRGV